MPEYFTNDIDISSDSDEENLMKKISFYIFDVSNQKKLLYLKHLLIKLIFKTYKKLQKSFL